MANIKATIFFDKRYWVATFERTDKEGYAVAKHIFGAEPADPIEHHDRLMRFGIEYVEAALAAQGRKLVVADSKEVKDDLVQDMIEVLTSFCARLYGRRSAKNKAKRAVEIIQNIDSQAYRDELYPNESQ